MGIGVKNIRLICEYLESEGNRTTLEIKDHINSRTKYGTTSAELKAFMSKHSQFELIGSSTVKRPTGSYACDMWKVKKELLGEPEPEEEPKEEPKKRASGYTKVKWTEDMYREFVRLKLVDGLSLKAISEKLNLSLGKVKGVQKDYFSKGKLDDYVKELGDTVAGTE